MAKEILCGFGVDVDAVAGRLGFTAARHLVARIGRFGGEGWTV